MYFGADYYPEEWPRERWAYDAQLMAEAGFNVVRLGELAWGLLEPEPDRYDFSWLDDAIALLHAHGISTVLGTPTTAAPPWIAKLDPDVMWTDEEGGRSPYGSWGNYCVTGPLFRERTRRIVEAMARHYRDNPAVIAWQVDNEFGVHGRGRCYCDRCQEAFRAWLARRYGSLEALRAAWGATFWSHTYTDWAQVPIPRRTVGVHNPGLLLDFARFCSDRTLEYERLQVDILQRLAPHQLITHNFLGAGYTHLDNYQLAEPLDIVAWDNYSEREHYVEAALSHDVIRGAKGRNYWVLEQQCGHKFWAPYSAQPPGVVRLMSYQGIAHGADAIVYFRWRSGLIGAEQFHAGILPHDGRPGREYEEIRDLGRELRALAPALEGASPRAEVAFLLSYESLWALEHQPHHADLANPWRYFDGAYRCLLAQHVPVDFVAPTADLSPYRLAIAPALFVLRPEAAASLSRFVERGGTLLATVRSGEKDACNRAVDQPLPGLLAGLLGLTVREFDSLPAGQEVPVDLQAPWGGGTASASTWCERLELAGAEAAALYAGGIYTGAPAATWRAVGQGGAMYLGAMGDGLIARLLAGLLARAGVRPPIAVEAPPGVEVAVRQGGDRRIAFVLNFTSESQSVRFSFRARDLLSGRALAEGFDLPPFGVRIVEVVDCR